VKQLSSGFLSNLWPFLSQSYITDTCRNSV